MRPDFPSPGYVATFYSFKGGVGRSFLLANVAVTLADWGYRVLCVDWDLEAPGLDLYFCDYLGERPGGPGLVEMVHRFAAGGAPTPDWSAHVTPIGLRAFSGSLHLMTAGRQDNGYAERVQAINWAVLYEQGLGAFLESVREAWVQEYDLVLIDSRTGITDIGGICTIQFPDVLVPVLAANRQNLLGVVDVVRRAGERRERLPLDRPGLLVLPVLSRFEPQVEYELSQEWLRRIAEQLGPLTDAWRHKDTLAVDLLAQIKIPYVPFWSYGEKLAVLTEPKPAPTQISYPVQSVAALLARRLHGSREFLTDRDGYVAGARKPDLNDVRRGTPVRIFISSTGELLSHRAAVIDAIKRLGPDLYIVDAWELRMCREKRADYDVDYDVFLGMYGFRYGTLLPFIDQSGTEYEYRQAKAAGKPIIALLMADDAPISARDIDRGLPAERVDKLRTDIAASHTAHFFRTAEGAALAAAAEVRRLFGTQATSQPVAQGTQGHSRTYISYRRRDSSDIAARLYDELTSAFGPDSVFMDMATIPIGVDFRTMLSDALRQAKAVLVVIGPEWLKSESTEGRRLLDDPNDFVRLEIETALQAQIPVIPLAVDDAQLPRPAELPDSIRELAFRNGMLIRRGVDFHTDLDRLIEAIKWITGTAES